MARYPEGELLFTVRKTCGQEIRITRYRYKERSTIDVRVYNLLQDGTMIATKQGVRALESVWKETVTAMQQIPLTDSLTQ